MDLSITRKEKKPDGIFSHLHDVYGRLLFVGLEHAYPDGKGGWTPKILNGVFTCVRSKHRLLGMDHDFETFEITGVEGHSNLLFHWGNWNKNSEGCILVGASEDGVMITMSQDSFKHFMQLQEGADMFSLTVQDE